MTIRSEVGHWALVPSWVRKQLRGQSRAIELYVLLADIANHDDNVAQRRRGWLAKELACSPDTLDRSMAILVRAGAVTVERRYDSEGANIASNYLVHQVPPPGVIEGGGRTDADRGDEADAAEAVQGAGRASAARGPRGSGEVAAPIPVGARADAATNTQPSSNQPPSNHQERPDAASAVGGSPEGEPDPSLPGPPPASPGRQLTEQQILWATIAAAFDWDPLVRDPDQRKQVEAAAGKLRKRNITGVDIDEIRDRAWWFRATQRNVTPAMFGERWGTINVDRKVVAFRSEAVEVIAAATAALDRPLLEWDRLSAELAVAILLGRNKTRLHIKRALQRESGPWEIKYLERAVEDVIREQASHPTNGQMRGAATLDHIEETRAKYRNQASGPNLSLVVDTTGRSA